MSFAQEVQLCHPPQNLPALTHTHIRSLRTHPVQPGGVPTTTCTTSPMQASLIPFHANAVVHFCHVMHTAVQRAALMIKMFSVYAVPNGLQCTKLMLQARGIVSSDAKLRCDNSYCHSCSPMQLAQLSEFVVFTSVQGTCASCCFLTSSACNAATRRNHSLSSKDSVTKCRGSSAAKPGSLTNDAQAFAPVNSWSRITERNIPNWIQHNI